MLLRVIINYFFYFKFVLLVSFVGGFFDTGYVGAERIRGIIVYPLFSENVFVVF